MLSSDRFTTGIAQLDRLLGGLLAGDNVVWHDDHGSLAWTFCRHFLKVSVEAEAPIIYVCFDLSPKALADKLGDLMNYEHLIILDCFTWGLGGGSPVFLRYYETRPANTIYRLIPVETPTDTTQFAKVLDDTLQGMAGNVRLVFDSLTGMQQLWGGEEALGDFYGRTCPRLYELDTVAYWIMEKQVHSNKLKSRITQVAQVVMDLAIKRGTASLTVIKADKRSVDILKKPFTYWTKGDRVTFDEERKARGGLELGGRVREIRTLRGLSQTELARQVGVTPSTISQVEGNLIYPSLPALFKMAEVLKVEPSSFFTDIREDTRPTVFRRENATTVRVQAPNAGHVTALRLTPVDFIGQTDPFLLEIDPGQILAGHFFTHKGEEFGCLLNGRLEMRINGQLQTVEEGDVVYLTRESPSGWKNPGPETARLLWLRLP